jgi:hypothetical protein
MVYNSMNINKMNNHISPQFIEPKKRHDVGISRSWLGTAGVKLANGIPTLHS